MQQGLSTHLTEKSAAQNKHYKDLRKKVNNMMFNRMKNPDTSVAVWLEFEAIKEEFNLTATDLETYWNEWTNLPHTWVTLEDYASGVIENRTFREYVEEITSK